MASSAAQGWSPFSFATAYTWISWLVLGAEPLDRRLVHSPAQGRPDHGARALNLSGLKGASKGCGSPVVISYASSSPMIIASVAPLWVKATVQPADVAEPAQYGFSVTGDRFWTDAASLHTERRRVGEHV